MLDCVAKVDYENTAESNRKGLTPAATYDVTGINGTPESVREYFAIGKVFNLGFCHDSNHRQQEDHMMKVVKVFVLKQDDTTKRFVDYLGDTYGWDWKGHFTEEEYNKFTNG